MNFELVHLLFSSCALFHSLFPSRAAGAVWEKKVIVASGWGECSLGATSVFNAHSKRKMQIFHATFWMCVCAHHHFRVELSSFHCISHTLLTHKHTDLNIFYSFSYSFGDYYYVLMFHSFFPLQIFPSCIFFPLALPFSFIGNCFALYIWYH